MKAKYNEKKIEASEKDGKVRSDKSDPLSEAGRLMGEGAEEGSSDMDLLDLDLRELLKELEEARHEAEETRDLLLRCRAELDNTLKRAAREKEALSFRASERVITKLLPVLDSLDQAAKQVEGMERVRRQLLDVLGTEGLAPIVAVGEKFDPYRHEALMMVESDECEEGTVTEEVLRGYALNSRVIRFSKVLVSKKR
ncbi:nucleotide exchange factor GrpE [Candidatus Methanocrinis natronophilus]|uniref:Protein GrpE n=1 Tax=Candidatus Methanocrinis natronophilus TaxID=3033396 RepID=A0ABT5X6A4_9EURY|nr:nucleotide exchange factor GrpE [Candidatus Methanocrinis natronophilus]MDF0590228.1 nucleotide exchange factor GrpE [Candidatus Methanocrinis natronophilus]